jgi:hypothetical protein
MRLLLQVVWFVVIFLSLLGLTALVVASFLPDPMSPAQFGYAVGRYAVWLLLLAVVIVAFSSSRGWLPGIPRHRSDA